MYPLAKSIDQWTESDLDHLVEEKTQETVVLEFKRELSLDKPSQKKEVAKDICALANTSGGWIVYGIDEERSSGNAGLASRVCPFDAGDLASRIENIVHSAIAPAPKVRVRTVLCTLGACIVVRVEASSLGVHQVVGYDDFRFYRRTDFAARPMLEPEVRDAFARVAGLARRAEEQVSALETAASRCIPGARLFVALVSDIQTDVLDPSALLRSDRMRASLHYSTRDHLVPDSQGLTANPGSVWVHCSRNACFAMAQGWEQNELHPNHVLNELKELFEFGRATCNDFGIHSSWHLALSLRFASPIPLSSHSMRPLAGGRPVLSESFIVPVTHAELLHDWEPAAARAMRRMYQVFGRADCPLFDTEGKITQLVRTNLGL